MTAIKIIMISNTAKNKVNQAKTLQNTFMAIKTSI